MDYFFEYFIDMCESVVILSDGFFFELIKILVEYLFFLILDVIKKLFIVIFIFF